MAVMEEEINYKKTLSSKGNITQNQKQNQTQTQNKNQDYYSNKIISESEVDNRNNIEIDSRRSDFINEKNMNKNLDKEKNEVEMKRDFENIFGIKTNSQTIEFIENYNMIKLGTYIENVIPNPNNTIIIFINPKNSLMDMLDFHYGNENANKNDTEYDFKLSKLFKIWNLIVELSKNIKDKDIECRAFDINLNSKLMIINKIKIFFAGKNLEFLYDINSPITNENNDKFLLPIIERCMKFSTNRENFDIYNCINQLKEAIETNKFLFPECESKNEDDLNSININSNNNKFYNNFVKIPGNYFYRIIMFNGVITEKINENDFDNLLIKFKKNFRIVFNLFNFEYDYLFEKKVYDIFERNDLFDFRYEDYHFFLKSEENSEFEIINNYKNKVSSYESILSNYFINFNKIKNLLFKNQKFITFAKNFDQEFKSLMDDYHIIKKNYQKLIDSNYYNTKNPPIISGKAGVLPVRGSVIGISSAELLHIKKNFEELLNNKVIKSHLNEVKKKIDFRGFKFLLDDIESEINSATNKLINDFDNELENISNMSKLIKIIYYNISKIYYKNLSILIYSIIY
jgi:hypothetical protein